MATWGPIVESTVGTGDRKHAEARVSAQVRGERADALARLEKIAREYRPDHPLSHKRRRLFRNADGFLLVIDGSWQSHATRFTVAELLEDSAAPAEPTTPEPEPEAKTRPGLAPDEPAVDADGVPVRPAWLRRKGPA
ncbi:hypothetical protein ACQEVS_31530 [Streptomyces sp. CA-181903]|uniref:hypothetical protein n=1 Tax=Streptomyces sp. CA-181903 TaxID=3240055 RepID=UPI003D9214BF